MKRTVIKAACAAIAAIIAVSTLCACGGDNSSDTAAASSDKSVYDFTPSDYVKICDYMSVRLSLSESELASEIDKYLENYSEGTYEQLEGTVKDGDTVNADYQGTHDGVAFSGGTASNQIIEIGSNTLIDGFEDGLIGAKTGDTVTLNLTFPETYPSNPDLAGEETVFYVKINYICGALSYSDEQKSDALKEVVWSNLLNQISDGSTFTSLPKRLVNKMRSNYTANYFDYMVNYQGYTSSQATSQCAEYADKQVRFIVIDKAIAELEGLTVGDKERSSAIDEIIQNNSSYSNASDVTAAYGEEEILQYALQDMVNDYLYENLYVKYLETSSAQ